MSNVRMFGQLFQLFILQWTIDFVSFSEDVQLTEYIFAKYT